MCGQDFQAEFIKNELRGKGIGTDDIRPCLRETPSSAVLYDESGRRQIYCDLKDIQETAYALTAEQIADADMVVACNINFNRELLSLAKQLGKIIATDVHVLGDVHDGYNRQFMECADILFLSDEAAGDDPYRFIGELEDVYRTPIIVMGRGSKGALMYLKEENRFHEMPAAHVGDVVNTVGAGDALFSAFLHFYSRGLHPVECLKRAQVFAAAKIRANGAAKGFVTEAEVEEFLKWY
jgi:ribokinase